MRDRWHITLLITVMVALPHTALAQNLLPLGFHESGEGGLHNFVCTADGWAVDPDNRDADVQVRVLADDVIVGETIAGEFRSDLEAVAGCPGGTCAFRFLLWGRITPGLVHTITVQARDNQTGEWEVLPGTPKQVRCFAFSLTIFDFDTGIAEVVAELPFVSGHFGAHWSPDGTQVSFNAVGWRTFPTDFFSELYIADLVAGTASIVRGIPCPSNLVWSPDGTRVAFEAGCEGMKDLFVASPDLQSPRLLRQDAVLPDWSPDGRRLVFVAEDGSLRTIDIRTKKETIVGFGFSPVWSPDGRWVAFHSGAPNIDIWKVRVSSSGRAIGDPIQLTSEPLVEGHPSWSADSQTIYFHSETRSPTTGHPLLEEFRLWSISASAGDRRDLTPMTGMAVDVAAWRNGNKLAYSGAPFIPILVTMSPNPAVWSTDVSFGSKGRFTFLGAVPGLPPGGVVLDGTVTAADISLIFQVSLDADSTPLGGQQSNGTPGSWVGGSFFQPPDSFVAGSGVGWIPPTAPDSTVGFAEGLAASGGSSAPWLIMDELLEAGETSARFFFSIPSASIRPGLTIVYRIVEGTGAVGVASGMIVSTHQLPDTGATSAVASLPLRLRERQ